MPSDSTETDQHTDRADLTRTVSPPEEGNPTRVEPTRPAENTENPADTDRVTGTQTVQKEPESQRKKGAEKPPPYRPPVPFPQRLAETKLNEQFAKFIDVLKQLHITIPFTEVLTQMPTYAKFLKDILSNKRSLGGTRQ